MTEAGGGDIDGLLDDVESFLRAEQPVQRRSRKTTNSTPAEEGDNARRKVVHCILWLIVQDRARLTLVLEDAEQMLADLPHSHVPFEVCLLIAVLIIAG